MSDLIGGGITPVTYNPQGLYSTIIIKDKPYIKDILKQIKDEINELNSRKCYETYAAECPWEEMKEKVFKIINKHLQEVEDNGGQ